MIKYGFCDILNNQGLGRCYQPQPLAQLITLTSTLIIPDITKTSPNNCLTYGENNNTQKNLNDVLNQSEQVLYTYFTI